MTPAVKIMCNEDGWSSSARRASKRRLLSLYMDLRDHMRAHIEGGIAAGNKQGEVSLSAEAVGDCWWRLPIIASAHAAATGRRYLKERRDPLEDTPPEIEAALVVAEWLTGWKASRRDA